MTAVVIGEMHHRLALEAALRTPDGAGGASETWSLVAEIWGALRPIGGNEGMEADGLKGRATHEIWIRWREGLLPEMRFRLGTRAFDIKNIAESEGRRRYLRCLVEERLP